jgi:DNA-binding CsgD family transcriptional regulator
MPAVWAGSSDIAPADARAWLDHDHTEDPVLAEVRRTHATAASGSGVWMAPVLGCGALIATLRAHARDDADHRARLSLAATLVSVRLALLGLEAPLAEHVRSALTARQYEVALLVARGCTNSEIGRMLGISANAVKKHVSRLLDVLGASNRTELAALAGRWYPAGPAPSGLVVVEASKSVSTQSGAGSSRAA